MEAIGPVVSEFVGWSDAAIGSIGGPTLLIVGDQEFVRLGARRADARAFPDAQPAVLPGTTHMQVIRRTDAPARPRRALPRAIGLPVSRMIRTALTELGIVFPSCL
jgi:pimeloyl-ACP methyl ester carboxylesterase